ncbi:40S ribosomal protein S16 [Puccinia graminis f. sp. tritici]|uniref:40S ribosomal protein S16 n=1 Tax=Puccinia graminis f. sp. tritici TaxID=56615 RepID=A0A5B0MBN4_PUCGR|nr:40S ribosomal protein S16 [Puccinia graminis f. sp. tritici]
MSTSQSVQTFGKKKTATAVAFCKDGKGLIRINGTPIALVQPEILRYKVYEPILIAGADVCCPWVVQFKILSTFSNLQSHIHINFGLPLIFQGILQA